MANKKLRSLGLIQRIKKHDLEAEAAKLGSLRHEISQLETERERLLASLQRDARMQSIELAQYVGQFIRAIRSQVNLIDRKLEHLRMEEDQQESVVVDHFGEVKTYDIVIEDEETRQRQRLERSESLERDDLTVMRWRRS
jgi:flagellar biosynthesis chaperone FliJ